MDALKFRGIALLALLVTALLAVPLQAADNYSDLMNKAGMQRMLSQRITKAYLYHGQGISKQEAHHQLMTGLKKFEYNHVALKKVQDAAIQELLVSVDTSFAKLKGLIEQPYKKENAALVMELSETLLGFCQDVVVKLEELSGAKIDNIINLSGRQRMLSQRISKYYIAYQSGFQDENSVQQLETAVSEFNAALDVLLKEKRNTERINLLLTKMKKLWKIVEPYFLKVRNKGNPLLVLSTTDDLTTLADEVTTLYVEVAASKKDVGKPGNASIQ
ncbi:type IV pili methyl-accepting chemotaxis transducer N-terminal domain-containing protein [Candidatus Electronema sp. PJ]|uniref:type IV pili methyl-accepting chemotaxis transducer N-terminal domain-containing protein n=1 Tax=Candidatus Electronema sp. PJ TaxID=3401572 RepID=UPI003AA7CA94